MSDETLSILDYLTPEDLDNESATSRSSLAVVRRSRSLVCKRITCLRLAIFSCDEWSHIASVPKGSLELPPICIREAFEACRLVSDGEGSLRLVAWAALALLSDCNTESGAGGSSFQSVTLESSSRGSVNLLSYDGTLELRLEGPSDRFYWMDEIPRDSYDPLGKWSIVFPRGEGRYIAQYANDAADDPELDACVMMAPDNVVFLAAGFLRNVIRRSSRLVYRVDARAVRTRPHGWERVEAGDGAYLYALERPVTCLLY